MAFVFKAENAKLPEVSAGMHNATVKDSKFKVAEKTGNLMIAQRWELEGIEDANGRAGAIFSNLMFCDGMEWQVKQYYEATGRSLAELEGVEIDEAFLTNLAEEMLGDSATLVIEMKPDTRDGGIDPVTKEKRPDQPRIKKMLPYGSAKSAKSLLDI